jgi:hypothetical protein
METSNYFHALAIYLDEEVDDFLDNRQRDSPNSSGYNGDGCNSKHYGP